MFTFLKILTQSPDGKLWDATDDGSQDDGSNYDPYAAGDYNNPQTGEYDPTLDPNNYDENGNYVGQGAYDNNGNLTKLGGAQGGGALSNFFKNLKGGSGSGSDGTLGNIGKAGQQASGAAAGLANQRSQQGDLASLLSKSLQQQYENQLAQSLTKQVYAPQTGANMAARGDILSNVQDAKANFTPGSGYSFSGGLRPSDLGPNARAAGQNLSSAGLSFGTNPQLPQTPNLTAGFPSTTPGTLESLLSGAGATTGILSTLFGAGGTDPTLAAIMAQLKQQGGAQNNSGGSSSGGDPNQAA